ncbi:site-specific integrase [Lacrimispora sp.]|uniref:site-specific integrase n=1 Tax=Lacrimispora sp. TaxID=2719234 RepID=UPI0028A000BC|nr:tyrosine-type recombinase/integrase [Lacrimispora sp.]
MAKAKKLPSGSWRCLVYDYTDEAGKRHYRSFTSDNPEKEGRLEAEHLAAEFAYTKDRKRQENTDMVLQESMEQYCILKSNVLSPSTLREYKRMIKNYYTPLISMKISKITAIQIQRWVNNFSATHSPKTTRNAFGLLTSTMALFKRSDILTDITMPQTVVPNLYTPSDTDVKSLLEHTKGTYLETAICLAAFGPMRRGEICALTKGDINGCNVTVSKSMVKGDDAQWHIKSPKTTAGYRTIEFPQFVIDIALKNSTGDKIVPLAPDSITKRFIDTIKLLDIPRFRFHDLRHYGASILHAIGVPDQYIIERGGWSTDNVMKTIYRSAITEESKKINHKINLHFETMQHDLQHDNKKA